MLTRRRQFGDWGEALARRFLEKRSYTILGLNYRKRCGEIDIVARRQGVLHFVEVKTRTGSAGGFGSPEEAVDTRKQRRLVATVRHYLFERDYPEDTAWQIDVLSIEYQPARHLARIRLTPSALDERALAEEIPD